ncbi:MAG: ribosomal protein L7/L12 [Pirellulales bacterium]
MSIDDRDLDQLRALLAQNQKIEAIKFYRELTGAGLKEAKDAVEALERGESLEPPQKPVAESWEPEIVALMEQGRKIEAIKLYREKTGLGLKDAKEAVEAIAARHGIAPSRSGCLGVVLLAAAILLGAAARSLAAETQTSPSNPATGVAAWPASS